MENNIQKKVNDIQKNIADTEQHYNKKRSGRKRLTTPDIVRIMALREQNYSYKFISEECGISRQTIHKYLSEAQNFSSDPDVKMRMNFMNRNDLCTTIDIDFMHEKVYIKNYTDNMLFRAFGVIENPTWSDFEEFMEERCFPRTRDHVKDLLRSLGLDFYDPISYY